MPPLSMQPIFPYSLSKLHTTTFFALSVTLCPFVLQVRREMLAQARNGIIIPPLTSFDGNVITPGTPFMARLAAHLRRFLAYKVGNDSHWRHIQVIPALMHEVVCSVSACTGHRGQWVHPSAKHELAQHPPIRMADCRGLEQLLYHLLPLT